MLRVGSIVGKLNAGPRPTTTVQRLLCLPFSFVSCVGVFLCVDFFSFSARNKRARCVPPPPLESFLSFGQEKKDGPEETKWMGEERNAATNDEKLWRTTTRKTNRGNQLAARPVLLRFFPRHFSRAEERITWDFLSLFLLTVRRNHWFVSSEMIVKRNQEKASNKNVSSYRTGYDKT